MAKKTAAKYKKFPVDPMTGEESDGICIPEERLAIPNDPGNTDWQEYLKWVAEGNTPEPADE